MSQIKFLVILSIFFLIAGVSCKSEISKEQEINYEKDVKPLIETTTKPQVRGSCNFINSKSTCIDFVGSIFNEERMKLSCTEGKFSLDACPYSDLGGCQATPGTVSESIVWSYNYGGSPISVEEVEYLAKSCNAMAISKWVKPDELIQKNVE